MKRLLCLIMAAAMFATFVSAQAQTTSFSSFVDTAPSASLPLGATDYFAVVQGGLTKKLTGTGVVQAAAPNFTSNSWGVNGTTIFTQFTGDSTASIALGQNALGSYASAGAEELGIGKNAGRWVTSGLANVGVGKDSMGARSCGSADCTGGTAITGNDNSAFGAAAGTNLQGAAVGNQCIGTDACYYVTTGGYNVAVGYQALEGDTGGLIGGANICLGYECGFSLTGAGASANIFIGGQAGYSQTSVGFNLFIGNTAGYNNTTGEQNVCIGNQACLGDAMAPLTGSNNTTVGYGTGMSLQGAGGNNLFVGTLAGEYTSTGQGNTALGSIAMVGASGSLLTGNFNTMVGNNSGNVIQGSANSHTALGAGTMEYVTGGAACIALGYAAGQLYGSGSNLTTCTNSIFIGQQTRPNADSTSNEIIIGAALTGHGDNTTTIGNASQSQMFWGPVATDAATTDSTVCKIAATGQIATGTGALGTCLGTSSRRFKTDIEDLQPGLAAINGLRTRSFYMDAAHGDPKKLMYGFIAEEAQGALPALVGHDVDGLVSSFDYLSVVPVAVHAIQQLSGGFDAMVAAQREQADRMVTMEARLTALEARVSNDNAKVKTGTSQ